MTRGRPLNFLRDAARLAGERFYADAADCDFCGTNSRYTSNASCVQCAINRSKARYAALDEEARAAQAARDKARYQNRKASG